MQVRLHGTKGECDLAAQLMADLLTVLSVSEPYKDRGQSALVRVYIEVRITNPPREAKEITS